MKGTVSAQLFTAGTKKIFLLIICITDDVASLAKSLTVLAHRHITPMAAKEKLESALGGTKAARKLSLENAR